jgi:NAD(P)-dependent dehydrogenase (short-subunit alcohol dehydrogenase family)
LVTGCFSGIGIETARALSKTGATLYITACNKEKAKAAPGDILEINNARLLTLNLNSLAGI